MQVETYEIEESKDTMALLAADSESIELIEKLGLDGQKGLSNVDTATRFPYRKLTKLEGDVFELLFPKKSKIEAYSDGIIPLRVLQVAAHARETDFLEKLYVWHPENADDNDPVLIGERAHPTEKYVTERFLLARWGDALEAFDALIIKAKKLWVNKNRLKLSKIESEIALAKEQIARIDKSDILPNLKSDISFYCNIAD